MKFLLILLIATGFSFLGCTNHQNHRGENKKKEFKKVTYVCPMHPQITSDKPGSCSICGMDLVIAAEEDSEEHGSHEGHGHHKATSKKNDNKVSAEKMSETPLGRTAVKLSLDKQQLIGVTTEEIGKKELFKKVKAPGRIAFDPELYNAQSEYVEALRQWRRVQDSPLEEVKRSTNEMIKSAKVRLKVLGLNSEQIKNLAKRKNVSEGLIIGAGKGENLIYADVFETDLSQIEKGQEVVVEGSFLGAEKLKGAVIAVDQVIDPKTRTGKVRIKIEKTKARIRPEAFVNVTISVPLGTHLAVPLESILDTGREIFVFVTKGEGKFEPRRVSRVFETDDFVAVAGGVSEGEIVVTSANFMLDSESRLKAVIKSANQSSGHNH